MKFYRDFKIKFKLLVLLSSLAFFLIAFVIGVVVVPILNHTIQESKRTALEYVTFQASSLSDYFAKRIEEVAIYSELSETKKLDLDQLKPFLKKEIKRRNGIYEKFIIGLPNGHFHNTSGANPYLGGIRTFNDKSPTAKPKSIKKRDYWQQTVGNNASHTKQLYVSEPMISYTTGAKQIVVAATILSDKKTVGLIGGSLPWGQIEKKVNQIKQKFIKHFGWDARFFLISRSGTYWYHWNETKIIGYKNDASGQILKNNIGENATISHSIFKESDEQLRDIGKKMALGEVGHSEISNIIPGEDSVIVFSPVKASGYALGVVLNKKELLQPMYNIVWMTLIACAIAILLSIAISSILSDRFVKPIVSLSRATSAISEGNDVKLPSIISNDEVGTLINNFKNMRDVISVREDELRNLNHTLEKRVEKRTEQLTEAMAKADSANKAKSEFLANMSHEIRTPMNGIIGTASLMENTQLSEQQQNYLSTIHKSSNALLQLINDILDFSKIEAGKLSLEPLPFNLQELVEEVRSVMSVNIEKNVEFLITWQSETPNYVLADPGRIRQILFNLVSNAIKFTKEGHIKLNIESAGTKDNKQGFKISVEDTGIGIPKDKQSYVFEKFHQAEENTTRCFGGTGLGLSICSELVQMMGGNIHLKSEPGKGSTFWFTIYLPLSNQQDANDNENHKHPVNVENLTFNQTQVLLAEDNNINMMIATEILETYGCTVTSASNGLEAVELASEQTFDLIFMDCRMPQMDGYQATGIIKKRQEEGQMAQTPVIAFTANAMKGDRNECIEAGMDDYISKPIKREELASALLKWLPKEKVKVA